jgi:hypothetical protein
MGISDACRPDKMDSCCPSGPGYYRPAALTNESSVLFGLHRVAAKRSHRTASSRPRFTREASTSALLGR